MTSIGRRLGQFRGSAVVVVIGSLALPSCELETREERLVKATRDMDVLAVERLLAEGADPNSKDASGVTPLLIAAERGDVPSVEALIKRGATVNAADVHGQTPLMLSAWSFRAVAVVALLRHGADPCLKSNDGRTALAGSLLRSNQPDASAVQRREVIEALGTIDCNSKRPAAPVTSSVAASASTAGRQPDLPNNATQSVNQDSAQTAELNRRGKRLFDAGDPEGALTEFRKALAIDASNIDALGNSAFMLVVLARYEEARTMALRALELRPGDAGYRALLAQAHGGLEDFDKAIEILDALLADRNRDSELLMLKGQYLVKALRAKEALSALRLVPPDAPSFHRASADLLIGQAHVLLGNHTEALAAVDRSLAVIPNNPNAYLWRSIILERLGQRELAIAAAQRAAALSKSNSRLVLPIPPDTTEAKK